jgi:hypothetical protein
MTFVTRFRNPSRFNAILGRWDLAKFAAKQSETFRHCNKLYLLGVEYKVHGIRFPMALSG